MNGFPSRETVLRVRATYTQGTRIVITHMGEDPYSKLKAGVCGTVTNVDDTASVFAKFDNGEEIGLLYGIDFYKKIED